MTAEKIQSLADEIENKIQGGLSPRPLLSVPHLVSDEASCYYQGYTLAEMSVHQTREHFKVSQLGGFFIFFYGTIYIHAHISSPISSILYSAVIFESN